MSNVLCLDVHIPRGLRLAPNPPWSGVLSQMALFKRRSIQSRYFAQVCNHMYTLAACTRTPNAKVRC